MSPGCCGRAATACNARWPAANRCCAARVKSPAEGSRYATLVHAVLTPATGEILYVNAGHPPAVLVSSDGEWTPALASTAPAVGLIDGAQFPSGTHRLRPGDTLIVMSDGVCEARNGRGDDFDLACLAGLARASHAGVATLADTIVREVQRHRGVDQAQDDVTVFILRRAA